MTKRIQNTLCFLFPLFLLLISLAYPIACTEGVKNGLSVGLSSALPSLFPAMVLSQMLSAYAKKTRLSPGFLSLLLGILCGFPIGAVTVANGIEQGSLSKSEGEKLLFFCNNAGPSFLILFCGHSILKSQRMGFLLFVFQSILSCLFYLLFSRKASHPSPFRSVLPKTEEGNFLLSFSHALKKSSNSFLYILSCIIFFSFLSFLCKELFALPPFYHALLSLFLELTGGVRSLAFLPAKTAMILCGAGVGWGGASVHLQTLGILSEHSLKSRYYFLGKLVYTAFLALFSLFLTNYL